MTVSELDVSSIVARTSRSYDALPYTSDPFPLRRAGTASPSWPRPSCRR